MCWFAKACMGGPLSAGLPGYLSSTCLLCLLGGALAVAFWTVGSSELLIRDWSWCWPPGGLFAVTHCERWLEAGLVLMLSGKCMGCALGQSDVLLCAELCCCQLILLGGQRSFSGACTSPGDDWLPICDGELLSEVHLSWWEAAANDGLNRDCNALKYLALREAGLVGDCVVAACSGPAHVEEGVVDEQRSWEAVGSWAPAVHLAPPGQERNASVGG